MTDSILSLFNQLYTNIKNKVKNLEIFNKMSRASLWQITTDQRSASAILMSSGVVILIFL